MKEPVDEFAAVTRRTALRYGALGFVIAGSSLVFHSPDKPPIEQIVNIPEKLLIGNLTIHPITVEHDGSVWPSVKDQVTERMKKYPYVIPEYFPPEYKSDKPNLIDAAIELQYGEQNRLFDHVAEEGIKQGNKFIVVDPARDKSFLGFREILQLPASAAQLYAVWPLLDYIGKVPNSTHITRRDFLKILTLKGAQATIAGIMLSGFGNPMYLEESDISVYGNNVIDPGLLAERDYRRVLVAEHLHELGKKLPPGSEGIFIYPSGHMVPIVQYVQDDTLRGQKYKYYKEIAKVHPFQHFNDIRGYIPGDGKWLPLAI